MPNQNKESISLNINIPNRKKCIIYFVIKEVQYNCSEHCSAHLFIIAISSYSCGTAKKSVKENS